MKSINWPREALASVVVFLVALPLCMGIAIASGAPPAMGLVSGIIGGLLVGSIAGSPLQVSGPAAGLAVIVYEIIQNYGLAALAPIIIVGGAVQIAAGALKLGQWFRAVSPAVIYGMLAGIGVLIFGSQFHVMVDDSPQANGVANLLTIPQAVVKGVMPMDDSPHHLAAAIGLLTLVTLVVWNKVRPKLPGLLNTVPAPLIAVVLATGAAAAFQLPIRYVEVPTIQEGLFRVPDMGAFAMLADPAILGSALALAVIASAEALLCAGAVDKLHSGVRTDFDRELLAQGVGNVAAGVIGGLPVTGVIVRSSANVAAGSKTRVSAILHGVWLLGTVLLFPQLLGLIPVSSLAAILVYIGWKLVNFDTMRSLWERGRSDFAIYAVTVVAIVATDLLTGLLVGIALSVLKLAYTFSHLEIDTEIKDEGKLVVLDLKGAATFVRLPVLARVLDEFDPEAEIHVVMEHLTYIDHACLELLTEQEEQREATGGKLILEWEEVEARSDKPLVVRAA